MKLSAEQLEEFSSWLKEMQLIGWRADEDRKSLDRATYFCLKRGLGYISTDHVHLIPKGSGVWVVEIIGHLEFNSLQEALSYIQRL